MVLRGSQGMADERGLGISVLNVNQSLSHGIGAHDLRFQAGPKPGALEHLPGGHTVRRVFRIGNGDPFDLRPTQIRQTADLIADGGMQAESQRTPGIGPNRGGLDQAGGGKVADEFHIGGEEQVERLRQP